MYHQLWRKRTVQWRSLLNRQCIDCMPHILRVPGSTKLSIWHLPQLLRRLWIQVFQACSVCYLSAFRFFTYCIRYFDWIFHCSFSVTTDTEAVGCDWESGGGGKGGRWAGVHFISCYQTTIGRRWFSSKVAYWKNYTSTITSSNTVGVIIDSKQYFHKLSSRVSISRWNFKRWASRLFYSIMFPQNAPRKHACLKLFLGRLKSRDMTLYPAVKF